MSLVESFFLRPPFRPARAAAIPARFFEFAAIALVEFISENIGAGVHIRVIGHFYATRLACPRWDRENP